MTYCLGIVLREGLVMAVDSRTNAGVDYISSYQKLFNFSLPGQRAIFIYVSGNLSMTQRVIDGINLDLRTGTEPNIHSLPTMHQIAQYIGELLRVVHRAMPEIHWPSYNP